MLLNGALGQMRDVGVAEAGTTLPLRAGPASRDEADATWLDFDAPFSARGLRPLSPVHLQGRVDATGNWTFTWIRRSRVPEAADAWSAGDAPLAETDERYLLEISDAADATGTPVHSVEGGTPRYVWSVAEQAAGFPAGLPARVRVRVAQLSEVLGPGAFAEKIFIV